MHGNASICKQLLLKAASHGHSRAGLKDIVLLEMYDVVCVSMPVRVCSRLHLYLTTMMSQACTSSLPGCVEAREAPSRLRQQH